MSAAGRVGTMFTAELSVEPVPSARFSSLKDAIYNVSVHGTRLMLQPGVHGPFSVLHDYPEEHDDGRWWPDHLVSLPPSLSHSLSHTHSLTCSVSIHTNVHTLTQPALATCIHSH